MEDQRDENASQQLYAGKAALSGAIDHTQTQVMREQRIQSAIWALTEARRVRNDPALIAEIRDWVAQKRNEFMLLLDDLSE